MTSVLLDSAIGIVILLSVIFAFFRGFVREMLTIVNIVGASAASFYFSSPLTPTILKWLKSEPPKEGAPAEPQLIFGVFPPDVMASFLSYAGVFFGVFLILTLAGLYISGTIKSLGLGPADKTLGVAFGALRGFAIVFVLYLPFAYFMAPEKYPEWAQNSVGVHALHKTYVWGDEYFKARDKNDGQEGVHVERPVDPDSLAGKLRKMADDARQKAREQEEQQQGLTADEHAEQMP